MAICEKCIHDGLCISQRDLSYCEHADWLLEQSPCELFKDKTNYAEVVRCGKCIHNENSIYQNGNVDVCWFWGRATTADGYCDRGIERECE